MKNKFKLLNPFLPVAAFVIFISAVDMPTTATTLPAVNTREFLGEVDGIDIEAVVQSPSAQETSLQIVCLFEYTEGDIFNSPPALPKALNGMAHVDESLHGLISELRKTNKFEGKSLETLLIIPPSNTIAAKKLLLIGLGNRNDFKPEIMQLVGVTGMREALRLGVADYSHASDLKDAGIDSPTAEVARNVILGAMKAYRTQLYLKEQNASNAPSVKKISLLAGPAYFEDSKEAITKVINTLSTTSQTNPK